MKNFTDLSVAEAIQDFKSFGNKSLSVELERYLQENPNYSNTRISDIPDFAKDKPWIIKEHTYLFIDEKNGNAHFAPLRNALSMKAEMQLMNSKINLRIGNVYVHRYPGAFGKDIEVLFEFSARHAPNSGDNDREEVVNFTQIYNLNNGGSSGTAGLMAVKGLIVPRNGIDFKLNTIYVRNKRAEKLLEFLKNPIFESGVEMISSANPVVEKAATYAKGIVDYISKENKGRLIQEVGIGFDFAEKSEVASLKYGTYAAIQGRRDIVKSKDWIYSYDQSLIVNKTTKERLPYNHMTFVISEYRE